MVGGWGGKQNNLTRGTVPHGVGWWTERADAGNLRGVVSRQAERNSTAKRRFSGVGVGCGVERKQQGGVRWL